MKELLTRLLKVFNINKQTNKQMYCLAKIGREVQLFTRISLFRMCEKRGDWYYLVSSSRDVYA